jgi:predicted RNase H-like HicB family nuclease
MKTYAFKVLVEPDENRWHAHCPALQAHGASTWGATPVEAYKHIQEVVEMIVQELREDGIAFPTARLRMSRSSLTPELQSPYEHRLVQAPSPARTVCPENGHPPRRSAPASASNPLPLSKLRHKFEWSGTCPFEDELIWMSLAEKKWLANAR